MTTTLPADLHLRSAQRVAAETALQQISTQRGDLDTSDVAAWAKALWDDSGTGVVDPTVAAAALEKFCDRAKPKAAGLGTGLVLSANDRGAQLRSAAADDGAKWQDAVDLTSVDARVQTLDADLGWLFSLDIRKTEDFQSLGKWLGNVWAKSEDGASWSDSTVQYHVLNALSRHGIPKAVAAPYLAHAFTDDPGTRTTQGQMFRSVAKDWGRGVFEREAKFDAFMEAGPTIHGRLRSSLADISDVRKELEDALGVPRGEIGDRALSICLEETTWGGDSGRRAGYGSKIFFDNVVQGVSHQRISDTLITTGLADNLAKLDPAETIAKLERIYGVPAGGIDPQIYFQGVDGVALFKSSYESYGR